MELQNVFSSPSENKAAAKNNSLRIDRSRNSQLEWQEPKPSENTYSKSHTDTTRPLMEDLRSAKNVKRLSEIFASDAEVEVKLDLAPLRIPEGDENAESQEDKGSSKFGMWDGVFARCLLNIFGVIMFLRLSWMIGYAGIGLSIVVILVSVALTTITTLSMSAICTNGIVKGGGAYYLISRSLGAEFGGAIGVMFYVANAVAVALYLVGFAETIVGQVGAGTVLFAAGWDLRIIALISLAVLMAVCAVGVSWVVKLQLGLLALLVVSILSFVIGCFLPPSSVQEAAFVGFSGLRNFFPDWSAASAVPLPVNASYVSAAAQLAKDNGVVDFSVALSVFFPAVTGVMAGANISGDLKDPSKAIPKGTILAVIVSTVVYIVLGVLLGLVCLRSVDLGGGVYGGLLHDSILMAKLSFFPPLVYAGIYAATLSSGLASLVGAPRILQAVAIDELFPGTTFLARMYRGEPYPAYALTVTIAAGCILMGDINAIAPLITNFFMASYALVNYACFASSNAKTPGWRPTFKYYNKWLALVGAVTCFGFMLFLDTVMGFVTVIIGAALYKFVEHNAPDANWGSASEGSRYLAALRATRQLNSAQIHVKNFRPQFLVLSGNPEERPALGVFAGNLRKSYGITVFGNVVLPTGNSSGSTSGGGECKMLTASQRQRIVGDMEEFLTRRRIKGFAEVVGAPTLRLGVQSLLQTSGIGRMRPNTLIMGYKHDWPAASSTAVSGYVHTIGDAFDSGCGVMLLRGKDKLGTHKQGPSQAELDREKAGRLSATESLDRFAGALLGRATLSGLGAAPNGGKIDVWWLTDDGGLTVLLPHILVKCKAWSRCEMRVMTVLRSEEEALPEVGRMRALMSKFRIPAETVPVINANPYAPSAAARRKYQELGVVSLERSPTTESKFEGGGDATSKEGEEKQGGEAEEEEEEEVIMLQRSGAAAAATAASPTTDGAAAETEAGSAGDASDLIDRSLHYIRMGELVREHSSDARLVVISLPVPQRGVRAEVYMSWIETLSDCNVPVVLMRGNQQDVLTFYS